MLTTPSPARVSEREAGRDRPGPIATAGIAFRLAARAVDVFVVLIVVLVGSLVPGGSESATATWASVGLVTVAVIVGEAYLLVRYGRTPGMTLLGLRVVATTGSPLPFWRAAVRAAFVWSAIVAVGVLAGVTGAATLAIVLLGLIAPMRWRRDHRGLHDVIAASVVVVV